jgi:hypothetical protein
MKIRVVRDDLFMRKDNRTDRRKDRRTDGHDKVNSRFSQFCESLKLAIQRDKPVLHKDIWRIVKTT